MSDEAARDNPRRESGWRKVLGVAFRAVLAIHVLAVFVQAVSAGQFLSGAGDWLQLHDINGTAVIGSTVIVMAVLAVLIWRPGRGPAWPLLATVVLFLGEWMQIEAGYARRLAIHIPLGMAIFGLALLMLIAASVRPLARSTQ